MGGLPTTYPIPINNSLIGAQIHHQAATTNSGANALGLDFSNGLTVVVGVR